MAQPRRTFRIFVSSTFSDLKAERNALQERVFPKLRELCMQHGARFQAIDLRWGVSEEAAVDQQTMNICLEELRRCQRITPRPNVIVLLGERYGWMPLPPQIPADEFQSILEKVSPQDRDLLLWRDDQAQDAKGWYRRDANAVPPEYVLQPRTGEYVDSARWAELEARLHRILFDAVQQMDLPEAARRKYERSATEQEILEGAFQAGTDHAFCYFRTIEGLPQDERARDFLDLDERGTPASGAQARLEDLKARLRRHFPAEHIYDYQARWSGEGVTGDHLDALCARVEADLSRVILEQIAGMEEQDDLTREIEAHRQFGEERCRHFIGREEIIEQVRDHVRRGDSHPLVVWGVSGSGKSALMARCVELIHQELPSARLIHRYVGATPASTDIRSLLESLCREICREYGQDEATVPSEYKDLVKDFQERLAQATSNKPLILFLDALDQLSPTDNAHMLTWLPRELPENVRVVASALEREGPAGESLRVARAKLPPTSLIEVTPLTPEQGDEILAVWLRQAQRTLQGEQRADILSKFERCPLPLYLKLAFEEARRWKSYDGLPCGADAEPGLSTDIEGIIADLFARLEHPAHHGQTLVSKAMGYLAAVRHGLTEDEILDVLSADEDVFRDFIERAYHEPPERRLPVVVWSRLFFDLEPYLTERSADNTSLLTFYHRQLAEVVTARYVTEGCARPLHQRLANYFSSQPHWFGQEDDRAPNYRKCSELPFQQTHAEAWDGLEQTLTDLTFIEAKCTAGMTYDLVMDYNRIGAGQIEPGPPIRTAWLHDGEYGVGCPFCLAWSAIEESVLGETIACPTCGSRLRMNPFFVDAEWNPSGPQREVSEDERRRDIEFSKPLSDFGRFVRLRSHVLVLRPDLILQEAHNLSVSGSVSESADRLLQYPGRQHYPWLRLLNRPVEALGACLQTLDGHVNKVNAVVVTPDGKHAVTGSNDNTVKVWDLETGACLQTFRGHTDHIDAVAVTPDGRIVVTGSEDGTLRIWDLVSGACSLKLDVRSGRWSVAAIAITPDGRQAVTGSCDAVKVWDLLSGACLRTLQEKQYSIWMPVAVTPEGRQAVAASDDYTVKVWDLETGVLLQTLQGHTDYIRAVAVTPDGRRVLSGSYDGTIRVWDLATGRCVKSLSGHEQGIMALAVTPDAGRVVSADGQAILRVFDLESYDCLGMTETHHAAIINDVAVMPDARQMLTASWDCTVKLWDLSEGRSQELEKHGGQVHTAAITPDSKQAVTGSFDKTIKTWDLVTGRCQQTLEGHTEALLAIATTPDSRQAISSANWPGKGGEIRVWDLVTGDCLFTLEKDTDWVHALAVSSDGKKAITGSGNGTVKVWDMRTGACLTSLSGHTGNINVVILMPDGRLAITGSDDKTVKVWEVATGKCLQTLQGHSGPVTAVTVTPDGSQVVTGGEDKAVRVWETGTWACLHTLGPNSGDIRTVAITPDGRFAVSGGRGIAVRMWDLANGICYKELVGHRESVICALVMPDGRHAVTGSWDRTVKVWDLLSGKEITCFFSEAAIWACALSPLNRILVGDDSGRVYLLALENVIYGPPIVTAWHSPVDGTRAFGCVLCRVWSEVPESALGTELPCPSCGKAIRLNPFTITADWRPIAAAWRGEPREDESR